MSETITAAPAAAPEAAPAAPATPAAPTTPAPASTVLGSATTATPTAPAVPAATPAEGDKPAEATAEPAPITPVEYADFELPEGMAKESPVLDVFRAEAGKLGITQAQAQALVAAVGAKMLTESTAGTEAAWQGFLDQTDKWETEIKADPVIGGAKFDPTIHKIAKLFDDYIGPDNTPDRKALNEALLHPCPGRPGNMPALVRAFAKLAEAHTEGSIVTGSPARAPVDVATLMYPSMAGRNGSGPG